MDEPKVEMATYFSENTLVLVSKEIKESEIRPELVLCIAFNTAINTEIFLCRILRVMSVKYKKKAWKNKESFLMYLGLY